MMVTIYVACASVKLLQLNVSEQRGRMEIIQPVREAVSYRGLFTAG